MTTRVFVGGLPYATTDTELAARFRPFGQLDAVEIVVDRMSGRSKGFGFVTFFDEAAANEAVNEINNTDFGGRSLAVNLAWPRADRPRGNFDIRASKDGDQRGPETVSAEPSGAEEGDGHDPNLSLLAEFDCSRALVEVASQASEALMRRIASDPGILRTAAVDSRLFEEIVAEIWAALGYEVELTKRTRDGGRDIVAIRRHLVGERYLIECKRPPKSGRIGVRPVRELYGIVQHERATKGVLATTAYFTKDATMFFKDHMWELEGQDYDGISRWLQMYVNAKRLGS